jgi:DNA-binding NtrC family response regulator
MNQQTYYQKNIMIVDDDPEIVNNLQELLKSHGFHVTTANNSSICLYELEKGFQGIIIFDLKMPFMIGIGTIKKIITTGFIDKTTIIVLTAKRIQGEEFDEIYPYIYEYIIKPFDMNALLQTIKKIAQQPPRKRI